MTKEEKIKLMETVPYWWHYIDLGDEVMTPGTQGGKGQGKENATTRKLSYLKLPEDLTGKTVLDLGCSDGFFSFECKKRGAKRVVAVDNPKVNNSKAFVTARKIFGANIQIILSDIYDLDIKKLGKFDIVLGLGLLYHLKSPLMALDIIRNLTKSDGFTLIESHFVARPESIMEYKANVDVNGNVRKHDHSMWHPSLIALEEMMKDVGFKTEVICTHGSRVVIRGE